MKQFLTCLLLLSLILCGCTPTIPDAGAPVTDHNWDHCDGWSITRTDAGRESATIDTDLHGAIWYKTELKPDTWTVSSEIHLLAAGGDSDCGRFMFRDVAGNPCLTVTVEYVGTKHVQLRADAYTNTGDSGNINGWRNLFISDGWCVVNPENPLFLVVTRTGTDSFAVSLSQYDTQLVPQTSVTLEARYLDLAVQAGVGTYDSYIRFTGFAIQ